MKSRVLTALAACLFLLLSLSAVRADNNGTVTGIITDSQTSSPIPGVSVAVEGTRFGGTTGNDGRFTIENLQTGRYVLIVSHPGYQSVRVEVDVVPDQPADIAISLRPTPVHMGKVAIPSVKTDIADRYTTESLARKEKTPDAEQGAGGDYRDKSGASPYSAPADGNYLNQTDKTARMPREKPYIYPATPDRWNESEGTPYDMFFKDYGTHNFVDTRRDPFSTFGVDVDDASFNVAKEYLSRGYLPPSDAIRVEEFLNHFNYGYNPPRDKKFRVFSELTPSPFDPRTTILKIGIKGQEIERNERRPLNLTFVIDVSGSMREGGRLELVKESLRMLVRQLRPADRISIVAYGSSARVELPPTPADQRREINNAIDRLYPGGSTFAEAGIKLGYTMANQMFDDECTNRVVLCSDGVANVGQTNPDAIMRDIKRFADRGIVLSTFGYGMGNYNDVLLERLATQGNGRYAYVNDLDEARKLFVEGFMGNIEVLARDVKVQVEFNPRVVASYRLLGYENRDIADERFRDNRQDGGEIGSGHEVTVLYELVLAHKERSGSLATVNVRWIDPDQTEVTELSQDINADRLSASSRSSRPEIRLAVVASRFSEMLKGTVYASETSWNELRREAAPLVDQMGDAQTRELLDLIDRARDLSVYHTDVWDD